MKKSLRFSIFDRDGFTCQYCGKSPPEVMLHVDHIQPKSKGGSDEPDNLITSCSVCNIGKGARVLKGPETESSKMRRLQEALETRKACDAFVEASNARIVLKQEVVNYFCEMMGTDTVRSATVNSILKIISEFGVNDTLTWLDICFAKDFLGSDYYREQSVVKYLCGIARNHRDIK